MIEFRATLACPPLPPLRLDRSRASHRSGPFGLTTLSRGLFVLAALALPVLGLRSADPARPSQPGATQAAAVSVPPPDRMAAVLRLR